VAGSSPEMKKSWRRFIANAGLQSLGLFYYCLCMCTVNLRLSQVAGKLHASYSKLDFVHGILLLTSSIHMHGRN